MDEAVWAHCLRRASQEAFEGWQRRHMKFRKACRVMMLPLSTIEGKDTPTEEVKTKPPEKGALPSEKPDEPPNNSSKKEGRMSVKLLPICPVPTVCFAYYLETDDSDSDLQSPPETWKPGSDGASPSKPGEEYQEVQTWECPLCCLSILYGDLGGSQMALHLCEPLPALRASTHLFSECEVVWERERHAPKVAMRRKVLRGPAPRPQPSGPPTVIRGNQALGPLLLRSMTCCSLRATHASLLEDLDPRETCRREALRPPPGPARPGPARSAAPSRRPGREVRLAADAPKGLRHQGECAVRGGGRRDARRGRRGEGGGASPAVRVRPGRWGAGAAAGEPRRPRAAGRIGSEDRSGHWEESRLAGNEEDWAIRVRGWLGLLPGQVEEEQGPGPEILGGGACGITMLPLSTIRSQEPEEVRTKPPERRALPSEKPKVRRRPRKSSRKKARMSARRVPVCPLPSVCFTFYLETDDSDSEPKSSPETPKPSTRCASPPKAAAEYQEIQAWECPLCCLSIFCLS
ncbi:uncharacterized protein LOC125133298 [Phacochoerus africanus]|nr:uncharacterized protein LOC125133298 [Phacochoerus africanus]